MLVHAGLHHRDPLITKGDLTCVNEKSVIPVINFVSERRREVVQ